MTQAPGGDGGEQSRCAGADDHHIGVHAAQLCRDWASATSVRTAMPVPPEGT